MPKRITVRVAPPLQVTPIHDGKAIVYEVLGEGHIKIHHYLTEATCREL